MQTIVVFGLRFHQGKWTEWEHVCSTDEIDGVLDSAKANALQHGRRAQLMDMDFLEGSKYMFNVAYGPRDNPAEGDVRVFAVRVDNALLGDWNALKQHLATWGGSAIF